MYVKFETGSCLNVPSFVSWDGQFLRRTELSCKKTIRYRKQSKYISHLEKQKTLKEFTDK